MTLRVLAVLGLLSILVGCASGESVAQGDAPKSFPREQIAKAAATASAVVRFDFRMLIVALPVETWWRK